MERPGRQPGERGSWVSQAWIGIDGNTDVTQIGTLQSVTNVFGPVDRVYGQLTGRRGAAA